MGFDIASTAYGTGNALIGTGLGILMQKAADKRQLKQQTKLQALQIGGQKEMTDYNMQKQMEMWQNTSYPAQMEMIKKAGLNPGLMYGMGGGGGQTTGNASGNVTGGTAPSGGSEIAMGIEKAMQLSLMKAQKDNIEADTDVKKGEAANKPLQGENIKADTALKEINWNIQSIAEKIAGDTQNAVVARALTELRTATAAMHTAETQQRITAETADAAIEKAKLDVAIAATDNELKKAQTKATEKGTQKADEEIEKIRTEIKNMKDYYELDNFIEREKIKLMDKGINVAIITSVLGSIMNFAGRQGR